MKMHRDFLLLLLSIVCVAACNFGDGEGDQGDAPPADSTAVYTPPAPPDDGPHEVRDAAGRMLMKGAYRNGKRHGLWTAYNNAGGVKSRTAFVEGSEQGATVVYHENGMVYYSGEYRQGTPVGEWKFHDVMGELVRTVRYDQEGNIMEQEAPDR